MAEGWVVNFRYSIYSFNWYKTNTDAEGVSIARRRERR
jgi:hypothetical protein